MNSLPQKPKILAVDDRPENLVTLRKLLEKVDAELISATSGNEALKLTLKHDFSLAIVDVQMPTMDGYELVELMHGNPRTRFLPVIIVSAVYSDDYHRIRGHKSGAVDFLSKPIIPEILVCKVEVFLDLYRQKMELQRLIVRLEQEVKQRQKAEESQVQLLARLESSNQELEDFAHIVSHDLKAPLRGVAGMVKLLVRDYADRIDEQGQWLVDSLVRNAGRMQTLIDGILEYSKIGHIDEKKSVVDLNQLVRRVIDLIAPLPHLMIYIVNDLPKVWGNEVRLQQVFQNLIGNAVRHIDKPEGEIKIGCVEADEYWRFFVVDNGVGIERHQFDRIFQMFHTLVPPGTSEGTGIGLTVVKKIIEKYDGKIWVESEVGVGSTFFFTLPRIEDDQQV